MAHFVIFSDGGKPVPVEETPCQEWPTADLRDRILKFIDYYNATMAKPFKWTYAGRPLNV